MRTLWISLRPHTFPRQFTYINVGVIYHPPHADNNIMKNHICHCLDYVLQCQPRAVLSGDLIHLHERRLKAYYRLTQIVAVHTRGDVTLDNVYTNMETLYHSHTPVALSAVLITTWSFVSYMLIQILKLAVDKQ